jgi:hypothetical protein
MVPQLNYPSTNNKLIIDTSKDLYNNVASTTIQYMDDI